MSERRTPDGAADTPPLAGYRILVVDDEEDIRTYLLTVFADAGAQVSEAADGEQAIALALASAPHLITLDLSMPGMDGIETFRRLRTTQGLEQTPVCVVTGHPELRRLIYERPARPPEGYLAKPVDAKTLVLTARRILGIHRRRERERRGPSGTGISR